MNVSFFVSLLTATPLPPAPPTKITVKPYVLKTAYPGALWIFSFVSGFAL
jgi:hypothetical protein